MVDIPSSVKVGPFIYKILEDGAVEQRGIYAEVYHRTFEIKIDPTIADQKLSVSLWHELLHCLDDIQGMELDEKNVSRLANGIVMLLRDNPWLRELA